jgi:ribonuclease PH
LSTGVNPYAEGSALAAMGMTTVHCTASLETGVPKFLEGSGRGWVTAEYAMLPRATHTRGNRDQASGGRAKEISRLIGRSLRAAVDMQALAGYTVKVDCDVLVADGGTRSASINGGWLALALALAKLGQRPVMQVAAVSLGRVQGELRLDLCYEEDSSAELDLNLVLAPGGRIIEVQSTAERGTFSGEELARLVAMGIEGAQAVFAAQQAALERAA